VRRIRTYSTARPTEWRESENDATSHRLAMVIRLRRRVSGKWSAQQRIAQRSQQGAPRRSALPVSRPPVGTSNGGNHDQAQQTRNADKD
jgi:hypothetical protein